MRAAALIVLAALIVAATLTMVIVKGWNAFNYYCFLAVMREEGYTRGQAIDFADANPQIWKTDLFRSLL